LGVEGTGENDEEKQKDNAEDHRIERRKPIDRWQEQLRRLLAVERAEGWPTEDAENTE
jgi:hypothetical protein